MMTIVNPFDAADSESIIVPFDGVVIGLSQLPLGSVDISIQTQWLARPLYTRRTNEGVVVLHQIRLTKLESGLTSHPSGSSQNTSAVVAGV